MKTMTKLVTTAAAAMFAGAVVMAAATATENWENTCAACHGVEGKGDTRQGKKLKLKDYTDQASLAGMSDEELIRIVTEGVTVDGKQRKKGYKDQLSSAEIEQLVKLVRSFAQ
jgi:cytochrome c6